MVVERGMAGKHIKITATTVILVFTLGPLVPRVKRYDIWKICSKHSTAQDYKPHYRSRVSVRKWRR